MDPPVALCEVAGEHRTSIEPLWIGYHNWGGPHAVRSTQNQAAPGPVPDRVALHEALCELGDAAFENLLESLQVARAEVLPRTVELSQRAMSLLAHLASTRPEILASLPALLRRPRARRRFLHGMLAVCIIVPLGTAGAVFFGDSLERAEAERSCTFGNAAQCRYLDQDCGRGHDESCYGLAVAEETRATNSSKMDTELLKSALGHYDAACFHGHLPACFRAGHLYEMGRNRERAEDRYGRACKGGEARGCYYLGKMYRDRKDVGSALSFFEQACEHRPPLGCWSAGLLLHGSGRDRRQMLRRLEMGCYGRWLARMTPLFGDDVELYRETWQSCVLLGDIYQQQEPLDEDRVCSLYKRAYSQLRAPQSGAALGQMWQQGKCDPPPREEIESAYGRACDADGWEGCHLLAAVIEKRSKRSGPDEMNKALTLYGKACEGDYPESCLQLGRIHRSGRGGPARDEAKARLFYERACKLGEQQACAERDARPPPRP